eukprot:tig00000792_g4210.t1
MSGSAPTCAVLGAGPTVSDAAEPLNDLVLESSPSLAPLEEFRSPRGEEGRQFVPGRAAVKIPRAGASSASSRMSASSSRRNFLVDLLTASSAFLSLRNPEVSQMRRVLPPTLAPDLDILDHIDWHALLPSRGIDAEQISKLPRFVVAAAAVAAAAAAPCSVCLEELAEGERALRLPCSHHFHEQCIAKWLGTDARCPNCRQSCSSL